MWDFILLWGYNGDSVWKSIIGAFLMLGTLSIPCYMLIKYFKYKGPAPSLWESILGHVSLACYCLLSLLYLYFYLMVEWGMEDFVRLFPSYS